MPHPIAILYMYKLDLKFCYAQVVQANLSWTSCSDLPTKLSEGKATIIDKMVYCGGGTTDGDDEESEYIVYSYNLTQDKWTTLPPLPVRIFGLGHVLGKLVSVGGKKKVDDRVTDEIYSYDEQVQKWKQNIPPMPTARFAASVLSLGSALIVAGGRNTPSSFTDTVEVFHAGALQWYRTDPLPVACSSVSLVGTHGTCYALGGYKYLSRLNQVLYASFDDLLGHTVISSQTTNSGRQNDRRTQSAWKSLPNLANNQPAAGVLAGCVLAVGGKKPSSGANAREVYMFLSGSNSWIYFSDLPVSQFGSAVVVLSSTEILVIGGHTNNDRLSTVYKGTLRFIT